MLKSYLNKLEEKAHNKVDHNKIKHLFDETFREIHDKVRPYTLTTQRRMFALYNSVRYIIQNNIPGDFVECGVWKGGSAMIIALTLKALKVTDRKIYLYDTYEGMSEPTDNDVSAKDGEAFKKWKDLQNEEVNEWCYSSLEEVTNHLHSTAYPKENLIFVKGKVEDTIPNTIPDKIALLRLDTDWYESTYHELEHLHPLLEKRGVLLLDDYGYWQGARKAVDQYFEEKSIYPLINLIDHTGVLIVNC